MKNNIHNVYIIAFDNGPTGFYYIDYSLQNPGEGVKYLYSKLGMASNGWYNRLYTVTGQVWMIFTGCKLSQYNITTLSTNLNIWVQFDEGDSDKYGSMIQKVNHKHRTQSLLWFCQKKKKMK